VGDARSEFNWIDEDFIPVGQAKPGTLVSIQLEYGNDIILTINQTNQIPVLKKKAIPRLTIRLNGEIQPIVMPTKERLTIRIKQNPLHSKESSSGPTIETRESDVAARELPDDTEAESLEDEEEEEGTLLDEIDKFYDREGEDSEDAPDWMFEEGEVRSGDPSYVFCPAPHRKQILHLFTKYFCQHPIFPERNGTHQSADEIRTNAVKEMYQFCWQRGLREVWGYLWTSWYSSKAWKLWARSSSPRLSRLRTTMNVENFWRQIKHEFLHHLLHPRLDQLVWILISNVTPEYVRRGEVLEDTHRMGRSKPLTTYQKYFKRSWIALSKAAISDHQYNPNIIRWTCRCGQQKYDRHCLCKHLVQAVPLPPMKFWGQVYRRRTTPIYRHPALARTPESQPREEQAYVDPDNGCITDGDDHVWVGNPEVLKGGGGWRDFDVTSLGKRLREDYSSERAEDRSSSPSDSDYGSTAIQYGDEDAAIEEEVLLLLFDVAHI
jgi:hypothetical protein